MTNNDSHALTEPKRKNYAPRQDSSNGFAPKKAKTPSAK